MLCSSKKCRTALSDNDDLEGLNVDQVIQKYDWTPSPSWDDAFDWDGRIWCPEHAVEADDFWGEHADSEY